MQYNSYWGGGGDYAGAPIIHGLYSCDILYDKVHAMFMIMTAPAMKATFPMVLVAYMEKKICLKYLEIWRYFTHYWLFSVSKKLS